VHDEAWLARAARAWPALLAAIAAFALVLATTRAPGPGLDPDAVSYLGAAESLVQRGELRVPFARWSMADSTGPLLRFPPGYSAAIALPMRAGLPPVQSARLINALAAFVTAALLVLLVSDATIPFVGFLFGAALLAMPALHEVHVSVLSEPLFLALTALTLDAMVRRPDRTLLLGLSAALALVARYAGVSLVVAVTLWSALRPAPIRARVQRALAALAPGVAVQGLWMLHTRRVGPPDAIRHIGLYGGFGRSIDEAVGTAASWLVPDPARFTDPLPHRARIAALVAIGLIIVAGHGVRTLTREHRAAERPRNVTDPRMPTATRLLAASALVVVCYLAVVVVSRLLADPDIPFDQRILSPALVLGTLMGCVASYHWWRATRAVPPKIALLGAALLWWSASALTTFREARRVRAEGAGYGRERWRRSDLIAWARAEGSGHPLFTNRPAAVYFLLHRPARDVPLLEEAGRMNEFADSVRAHDGRVLMFVQPTRWFVTIDSLRRVSGLRPVFLGTSGVVLGPS
jgi:hypothetical protein